MDDDEDEEDSDSDLEIDDDVEAAPQKQVKPNEEKKGGFFAGKGNNNKQHEPQSK